MTDTVFAEAVRSVGTRMAIAIEPWVPNRADDVDALVQLVASEEVESHVSGGSDATRRAG